MAQWDRLKRKKIKEYIRQVKSTERCACGEARVACLDFHHKDLTSKRFGLSDGDKHSIKDIDAEIRKCIIVCANCHRILHAEEVRQAMIETKENEEFPLFDGITGDD